MRQRYYTIEARAYRSDEDNKVQEVKLKLELIVVEPIEAIKLIKCRKLNLS